MRKSPCTECPGRWTECHITCHWYIDWKEERNKVIEARAKEQSSYPELPRTSLRKIWKEMKRKQ